MFAVCLRYGKDRHEAEEMLQEGFIKVFSCLYQYRNEGSLEGWIRRIMITTALQHLRSQSSLYTVLSVNSSGAAELQEKETIESSISEKELIKLVQSLPSVYRAVFNLYVFEGYQHKEIASLLRISEGTSKSKPLRCKAMAERKNNGSQSIQSFQKEMPMSDDVHDIDDWFKKKLGNYAEETSPSAWEAVSHALDKQQATLYKHKYNRLKKAAFLLLLLCCLGGAYVAFDVWQHTQISFEQKQKSASLLNNKTDKGSTDKKDTNANVIVQNNSQQKKDEQKEKTFNGRDTASTGNDALSVQKQNAKAMGVEKKNDLQITSPSPFTNIENKKDVAVVVDENEAKQNGLQQKEAYDFDHPYALQDSYLQPFSLQRNKAIDLVKLQQILKDHKPTLLSTNTSAAIKIKGRTDRRFSLSLFAAPNFSFEKIEDNHHDRQGGMGQERRGNEENNFSFSGGALFSYVTKNINLQSGISVTAFSTFIGPKTVYAKPDNKRANSLPIELLFRFRLSIAKGNVPLASGDSSQTSAGTSQLVYVNIPALVSYQISKGRFWLLPTIGVGLNVLASSKIKAGLDDAAGGSVKTTTTINGLNRTYFNGSLGFGVEYKLNRKFSLGVRPNAKFTLTSINKEMPVKSYQNYLSVEAGVRMKL